MHRKQQTDGQQIRVREMGEFNIFVQTNWFIYKIN